MQPIILFQISDICQVSQPDDDGSKEVGAEVVSNGFSRPDDAKPRNLNELICLEETEAATEQLDGFTLDDLNDEVRSKWHPAKP